MSQTTYNVTIPHTSLEVSYRDDWFADCPVSDGKMVCGDADGNVVGSHTTSVTSAKFSFKFYGIIFSYSRWQLLPIFLFLGNRHSA